MARESRGDSTPTMYKHMVVLYGITMYIVIYIPHSDTVSTLKLTITLRTEDDAHNTEY